MDQFLDVSGISILIAVICFYYGIRTMMTGDLSMFRGKMNPKPLKDEKAYAKGAGWLLVYYGVANIAMGVFLMFNTQVGVILGITCTFLLLMGWFLMNRKYGA